MLHHFSTLGRSLTYNWKFQVRNYHALTGIFGNYRPSASKTETEFVDWSPESGLPLSFRLVKNSFKQRGYLLCQLDPLSSQRPVRELNEDELKQTSQVLGVDLSKFLNESHSTSDKRQYLNQMFDLYCGQIGYEFSHLTSLEEIAWFEDIIEAEHHIQGQRLSFGVENESDLHRFRTTIAKQLLETEALDHFLAKKFQSVKRYGCEGAETMVTFIEELIRRLQEVIPQSYSEQVDHLILGMPHRGRLNLLVNTLNYPLQGLFHKLSGKAEFDVENGPGRTFAIGDVLSHLYTTTSYQCHEKSRNLEATILPNPSHLEVVAPMVAGYARGKLLHSESGPYEKQAPNDRCNILPLQIHGDASFSGQGIIMETLAMANVEHYSVGGSIHLVVNNQVGYTTPGRAHQGRSSLHCSDPLKLIHAPVIHVNGENPELVAFAARLSLAYRQRFGKDIAVNLVCFRRWGHNELDDPTFTNPTMYKTIRQRKSIPSQYVETINLSEAIVKQELKNYNDRLNEALAGSSSYKPPVLSPIVTNDNSDWKNIGWPSSTSISKWETAVPEDVLRYILQTSLTAPSDWNLHKTLERVFKDRQSRMDNKTSLDWALVESLAFGSLLYQGYNVRISGQDVGRGTFSQRHVMVVDQENNDVYVPLNNLQKNDTTALTWNADQIGKIEPCNSILSEEAVMAYEYGLSLTSPKTLAIWEAQFGDFFNGAQSIIDTLICSGEAKWLLQSSMTLLLPHGYDGAGPEHTSSKLERFLQQSNSSEVSIDSDNVNWSVAYPSTPAQYFHLMRRQMTRPYRKPLVVMSPKMLLRHPRCVSTVADLSSSGAHFVPVLDDPKHYQAGHPFQVEPIGKGQLDSVRTIIFCSGKHYFALEKEREERFPNNQSIAIVRVEELCPFPVLELALILKRYPKATNLIWSQEEQRNMGAWTFVQSRFSNILQHELQYAGRGHLEAPAVGISAVHQQEVKQIMDDTFALCKQK